MADETKNTTVQDAQKNQQDTQKKTDSTKKDATPNGNSDTATSSMDLINNAYRGGSEEFTLSQDVLSGAYFKKYDNPQVLEGTQMQYASGKGIIKVVNFKQDYVV